MEKTLEKAARKKHGYDMGTVVMWLLFVLCVLVFYWTGKESSLKSTRLLNELLHVFFRMASIVGIIGIPSYFIGESLPRTYHPDRFPFKSWKWEKDGRVYEKLDIKERKVNAIDMSTFMRRSFPKQNTMSRDPAHMQRLVQEMCNAEVVHGVLMLLSPVFIWLIEGWYGHFIAIGYALCNVKDIIIQRYNRPRILKIVERLQKRAH